MRSLVMVVGIGLGFIIPMQVAADDNSDLRKLAAEWWQWAFSLPPAENPILDSSGEKCVVGQRGSTWFLAGTFGGGPATHVCSVPEGKALLVPLANAGFFNSPNVCGESPEDTPVEELRAAAAEFIDGVTGLSVEVDGKPVDRARRIHSQVFEVALPEDNLFDDQCASFGGFPGGIYSPAIDDGYYVLLKPLAAGEHSLHFHAENPDFGFVIDTTYDLTVVPVSRK
jgi:hypothetical protein